MAHADILELGMPFSDPLADGPVIQDSVNRALDSQTTLDQCFDIISKLRKEDAEIPIGVLVYFNLILSFGVDAFFKKAKEVGIDSILIPEIPVEELNFKLGGDAGGVTIEEMAQKYNISLVFLVSTNTPANRLENVIKHSEGGFIYAVSTTTITGVKAEISPETFKMVSKIKSQTDIPVAVGFGVSTPEHIKFLKEHNVDGAIMGSKLIKLYQEDGREALEVFLKQCMEAR